VECIADALQLMRQTSDRMTVRNRSASALEATRGGLVGGAIDSPNAEQLGYLRHEPHGSPGVPPQDGRARWRRWLWVALLAGVLAALAVTLVLTRPDKPEITTEAVGSWREIDTAQRYRLVLDVDEDELYRVIYDRIGGFGGGGALGVRRGDTIVVVQWRNGSKMTWTLSYDPGSDRLMAATSSGTFALERTP
jgi:hypothetical protein